MAEYEHLRDDNVGDHPDVSTDRPYADAIAKTSQFNRDAINKQLDDIESSYSTGSNFLSKDAPRSIRKTFGGK